MNQMLSGLPRRIDLALESPFPLGRLEVSPASLEVRCGAEVETLEPRVMQVLVALHRRRGEPVSREELSEFCWEGRIVGDDALNRAISRLRKALAGEPAAAIDTIPKVGYRLRVEGVRRQRPPATEHDRGAGPKRRRWMLAGAAAALLAVVGAAFAFWPAERTGRGVRPLTRDPGVETYPALAPDGAHLAYAAGPGFWASREIFLKSLSLGDGPPLQLTQTAADESSPAWSPDGAQLAFVRSPAPGEPCAIVVMTPPTGAERVVARCRREQEPQLDWLNPRELVFSDRAGQGAPRALQAVDVASGAVRSLTQPSPDILGDMAPATSPDGRHVAFRRSTSIGNDDLYVVDVRSGEVRRLTHGGWKAIGFDWDATSKTVFFTANVGGDFGLWSVDARRPQAPERVSPGLLALGRMSIARDGAIAVEAGAVRSNLAELTKAGTWRAVTTSGGADWDPDFGPAGQVVFGSDQNGSNEIWTQTASGGAVRLTSLQGSFVYTPRWSPNGERIAFFAVIGGRTELRVMRADGSQMRTLATLGVRKGTLVWRSDELLLYTERRQGTWRVMEIDLATGHQRALPGTEGAVVLRRAPDGSVWARTIDDERLQRLTSRGLSVTTPVVSAPDYEAWAVGANGVYSLEPGRDGGSVLWLTETSGARRRLADVRPGARRTLAVNPLSGGVAVGRLIKDERDLVLLDAGR